MHKSHFRQKRGIVFLRYKTCLIGCLENDYLGAGMNANTVKFDNIKAGAIVDQLLINASGVKYGVVSVSAKLHDGRVVEVSYSRTENTRDLEVKKEQER